MTIQLRNETVPANGQIILDQANLLFIIASSANVNLNLMQRGLMEQMLSIPAGTKLKRVKEWTQATIGGPVGTTVQFFYGHEFAREDETDFQTQIAVISGGSILASMGLGSPNAPTDHADVAVATGVTSAVIPVNALRKSVTIGSLAANAPATTNLRVQAHGSATGGWELQPGQSVTLPTQAALDVKNGDANAQTYWWQELT